MTSAGILRDHIAHVLNHVEGGPRGTRVYDRHSYDRENRRALETWARVLTRTVERGPATRVVPIRRRAAASS